MNTTTHYGLKQPEDNDNVLIGDLNDNAAAIDTALHDLEQGKAAGTALSAHIADKNNPHGVTAQQAGADPAGSAAAVQQALNSHIADKANPHEVTAQQAGAIPATQKGAAGGVAELDSAGKVPAAQLPAYVDDVLEYPNKSSFPGTGEDGKIYVAEDTNLTYRWSGSQYVEISPSLALGETSSTAYRGDRGKTAYDHSQESGNPHGTTAAQVGAATETTMTATVAATWTASGGYYYQDIAVSGILATDNPIVDINPGSDNDANVLYSESICKVFRITTFDNSVRVWATEAIEAAFPIQMKVVR